MIKDNNCRDFKMGEERFRYVRYREAGSGDREVLLYSGSEIADVHHGKTSIAKVLIELANNAHHTRLTEALEVAREALEWIVGYDGNQHTTKKAKQALANHKKASE